MHELCLSQNHSRASPLLYKLSLHPEKTKYLIITHDNSLPENRHKIFINKNKPGENDPQKFFSLHRVTQNEPVPTIKFLGVYFDENLNFKYHINYIPNKLSRALFSQKSVKNILPTSSLKTLYYSLLHCHLI
jgi:hypothetical protein